MRRETRGSVKGSANQHWVFVLQYATGGYTNTDCVGYKTAVDDGEI